MTEKETFAISKFTELVSVFPNSPDAEIDDELTARIKKRLCAWNDALREVAQESLTAEGADGSMKISEEFYKAIVERVPASLQMGLLGGFGLYLVRCLS